MDFALFMKRISKNIMCKQDFGLLRIYDREKKEIIVWVDRKRKRFY